VFLFGVFGLWVGFFWFFGVVRPLFVFLFLLFAASGHFPPRDLARFGGCAPTRPCFSCENFYPRGYLVIWCRLRPAAHFPSALMEHDSELRTVASFVLKGAPWWETLHGTLPFSTRATAGFPASHGRLFSTSPLSHFVFLVDGPFTPSVPLCSFFPRVYVVTPMAGTKFFHSGLFF